MLASKYNSTATRRPAATAFEIFLEFFFQMQHPHHTPHRSRQKNDEKPQNKSTPQRSKRQQRSSDDDGMGWRESEREWNSFAVRIHGTRRIRASIHRLIFTCIVVIAMTMTTTVKRFCRYISDHRAHFVVNFMFFFCCLFVSLRFRRWSPCRGGHFFANTSSLDVFKFAWDLFRLDAPANLSPKRFAFGCFPLANDC